MKYFNDIIILMKTLLFKELIPMNYTPLQIKTCYSLLQSLNNIESLVSYASSLGYNSLAITDSNNMFGVVEFYNTCKKYNIKPIIGLELDINTQKILLYAMNNNGYKNLVKLSTMITEHPLTKEDLINHKEDLILVIPYKYFNEEIYNIYSNHYIGYSSQEEKQKITEDKVFINDVSYLKENDYKYLDYAYMIKELKVLGEYPLNTHKGKQLPTKEELEELTDEQDINTTKKISNLCNVELTYQKGLLPV